MTIPRSSAQQLLMGRDSVLKAATLGIVGGLIFTATFVIGYQAERQHAR